MGPQGGTGELEGDVMTNLALKRRETRAKRREARCERREDSAVAYHSMWRSDGSPSMKIL